MGCQSSKKEAPPIAGSFYDLEAKTIDGTPYKFEDLRGKVVMITNVASKWGRTKQGYAEMIELSQQFASEGLVILAFPCNQPGFLCQEPGDGETIKRGSVGRGFDGPNMLMMAKVNVSDGMDGEAHSVYRYLCGKTQQKIKWNFGAFFLVSKTGEVESFEGWRSLARPGEYTPKQLADKIEALCKAGPAEGARTTEDAV